MHPVPVAKLLYSSHKVSPGPKHVVLHQPTLLVSLTRVICMPSPPKTGVGRVFRGFPYDFPPLPSRIVTIIGPRMAQETSFWTFSPSLGASLLLLLLRMLLVVELSRGISHSLHSTVLFVRATFSAELGLAILAASMVWRIGSTICQSYN